MRVRKIVVVYEASLRGEPPLGTPPACKALAAAVIKNPLAGDAQSNLVPLPLFGAELGVMLARRCLEALAIPAASVEAYGKGAIVGLDGELEHGAAILHPRLGKSVRSVVREATAMMPSTSKCAAAGVGLDVPLQHVLDSWSFDHFDTMSFAIPDAPIANEIVVAVALATGGRPFARTRREA